MQNKPRYDPAGTIFWVALILRVGWMTVGHSYRFPSADDHWSFGWETGHIARAIAEGRGFSDPFKGQSGPTAWIAPVYPYFLAALSKLFGTFSNTAAWFALAVNSVFSALTCVRILRIGREAFRDEEQKTNERVALWSAWLFALLPPMMFWAARWPWETALTGYLLSVVFLLTLRMGVDATLRGWLGFGALFGALALVNPSTLSLLPCFGLWIVFRQKERATAIRRAAAAALLFVAMIAPWCVRNYQVFGKPVFVRDNFWVEFRLGNGPGAEGYWMWWSHPSQNKLEEQRYRAVGEMEYIQLRKREALDWVRANPTEFGRVCGKRFILFWSGIPKNEKVLGMEFRDIHTAIFFLFSAIAWLGMWLAWRRREPGRALFAMVILVYPMVYYLTFPHERYRHPIEPEMMLLAMYAVMTAVAHRGHGRTQEAMTP